MSVVSNGNKIISDFLNSIDLLIQENISTLTCDEIGQLYFSLFMNLKKYRGYSGNFVGFGEYLVFRSVMHALGGNFIREEGNLDELKRYSFYKDNLVLSQGNRYKLKKSYKLPNGKLQNNFEPDVALFIDGNLTLMISMKTNSEIGVLRRELSFLEHVLSIEPSVRILLIIIDDVTYSNNVKELLTDRENEKFSHVVLRGTPTLFQDIINKFIH